MLLHGSAGAAALIATLMMTVPAAAFDDAKYPDWKGQWTRMPVPSYFPAQNSERRFCDLNRSICGKLQGRTDLN